MTQRDSNRVALITGANKGIGFAVARQFGQLGIKVLLGARDAARGETAAKMLAGAGIDARAVSIDVIDPASIAAAAADVEERESRLDILVNNAGIGLARQPPSELDSETLRKTLDTKWFGAIAVTRLHAPFCGALGRGGSSMYRAHSARSFIWPIPSGSDMPCNSRPTRSRRPRSTPLQRPPPRNFMVAT